MLFRTTPAAVSSESTRQKGPDCFRCTSGAKDFPGIRRARRYESVTPPVRATRVTGGVTQIERICLSLASLLGKQPGLTYLH